MSISRRNFLGRLSAGAAMGLLPGSPVPRLWALAPSEPIPEFEEELLSELALVAVDAARAAGAGFADVRIGEGHRLEVGTGFNRLRAQSTPSMAEPSFATTVGFGIRVVVDGAWGFAGGHDLSTDGVAQTARNAIARARANRPRQPRTIELAIAPHVTGGRWVAPIAQDPFAIPAGDQGDRQLDGLATISAIPEVERAFVGFVWQRALRVFASSEGTFLVQRTAFAVPSAFVRARAGESYRPVQVGVEGFKIGPYGYEAISPVDLPDALRDAAERAIADSKQPRTATAPAEVGRYDLVLGASAMARLLTDTLAPALDAERVLGYYANRVGTSFAAPPMEILGQYRIGSKLLNVHADRTRPQGAATVRWDDEGVPTEAFPLTEDGIVVDYLSNRQCAPELAEWYRAQGAPVRSRACASGVGGVRPTVRLPNLTLQPGPETLTTEDLIRDTKRGFYLSRVAGSSDHQLLNGQFRAHSVRVIRNGQLGEPIRDMQYSS